MVNLFLNVTQNGETMNQAEIFVLAMVDPSNVPFSLAILIITLFGIALVRIHKFERVKNFLPSLSVSIGVLGTFWGIFIGLSGFNTASISESIPAMLDGMKTAFFTSIIGMLSSIVLKLMYKISEDTKSNQSNDAIRCLQDITNNSEKMFNELSSLHGTLSAVFKSTEEFSLSSQVKLIRQEIIDGRRETKEAFEKFADNFSKMASDSIVNELKNVVDKFNATLNELVSESFTSLKQSTENLNSWQKAHVNEMQKNHKMLVDLQASLNLLLDSFANVDNRLKSTSESLDSIDGSLSSITITTQDMQSHSQEIANQNRILEASIASIIEAGERASSVVPELSERIQEISDDLVKMNKMTSDFVNDSVAHLSKKADSISNASEKYTQEFEGAIQRELENSLKSFAGAMVALSNKFASDYVPLTERLRDVLTIAQRVKNAPSN